MILCIHIGVFGIASSFAPSYDAFVALRFVAAMGGQAMILALYLWG